MNTDCVICLFKLCEGENNAYALVCGHVFHHFCIQKWITDNDSCPSCRMRCSAHQLVRLQWDEIEGPDERAEARARNHALMTCVTRLTNQIKTKNTKFQELEKVLRKVNVDMSCIAFNNQQLKQKNEDMKEVLGEMSIRRQFIHGADENSTQKDMMIEKLRQKVKSLKRRVRQEDDEGAMSDTDDDDDDEDEDADDEEDDDDTEAQAPASVAPQALIAPLAINVPQPLIAPETFNAPQTSIAPEALSAPFPLGPPFPLGHDMNPFIPRAELTDDDIANNGRDVEFEPEAEEKPLPFDIPGQQYALPCLPSTSQMENGVYHLFEYHKSFLK